MRREVEPAPSAAPRLVASIAPKIDLHGLAANLPLQLGDCVTFLCGFVGMAAEVGTTSVRGWERSASAAGCEAGIAPAHVLSCG